MSRVVLTCCGAVISTAKDVNEKIHTDGKGGWVTLAPCEHDVNIQVIPLDDVKDHTGKGRECWCEPQIKFEEEGCIVVHEARDGRE